MEAQHEQVQLTFPELWNLADQVAELLEIEQQKEEMVEDYNNRIKALKKSIAKLSGELQLRKRE